MNTRPQSAKAGALGPLGFWDALAPHHSALEDNYLDLSSIRRMMSALQGPVLVVGAGQGLIVREIQERGLQCDGVDFSAEMIRYAKSRRGITLIQADARSLPIADRTYSTVIYATGVIDFTEDETEIKEILGEGRRVVKDSGKIFAAFYRISAAQEDFLATLGLLKSNTIAVRQSLEPYLLSPAETIRWVANKGGLSYFRAAILLLRMSALCTMRERVMTLRMQRIFRRMSDPQSLINVFERIAVPIKQIQAFATCYIVRIQ
jgi:ubiquinone/menaquinone biosynthesis C-methylase UbiE